MNNNPEETISVTLPVFYNSREIKELGSDFVKIHGARSVGVLLTESTIFVAYNTCGSLMKWKYNSEIRVKGLISNTLCRERLPHQYRHDDIRGLMLGDSMEQIYQLLTSSGGSKRNYFVLDSTYNNFIYLPNDYNGEVVLKLLCDTEKTNELNHIRIPRLQNWTISSLGLTPFHILAVFLKPIVNSCATIQPNFWLGFFVHVLLFLTLTTPLRSISTVDLSCV